MKRGKRNDARRPAPEEFDRPDFIKASISRRWQILDWQERYPWWPSPPKVRILIYADGNVRFNGGDFLGMKYVTALLESRAYFYVDFDIRTAHRDGLDDQTATIKGAVKLDSLDIMKDFDEIWFFGFNSKPDLSKKELKLLDDFMAPPKFGGVLVAGDHLDLGRSIAGEITRAGEMRRYNPGPSGSFPDWNNSLEDGPNPATKFDFDDQSDDQPQIIRYEQFPVWLLPGLTRSFRPHPVLSGPDGPIDVLPDHQHEGEALAPVPAPGAAQWPTKSGHQERPYVIAWGKIKDPTATHQGQEFGVVSAYDGHIVDVGRIVADSSWHHWFDVNLTGAEPPRIFYKGFDETLAGQAALKKIDAYFLNCGVWLAPPDKQEEMRNVLWWSILWTDRILEIPRDAPIPYFGQQALGTLEQRASVGVVSDWISSLPIIKETYPARNSPEFLKQSELSNFPLEHYVAGSILYTLMLGAGRYDLQQQSSPKQPTHTFLNSLINEGTRRGLLIFGEQFKWE